MTERFRLAANVLLKRRLNNLVRIDNNVEIDRDFITCAEYQLFIDDMRQQGKNRQPDHWKSERFPSGDAKQPIIGVRASDAEEFCAWLTNADKLPGFKYRLPNITESKQISATIKDLGCWCKDNDHFIISGITAQKWHSWQQKFSDYLLFKDSFVFNRDRDLHLNRDLYLYLNRDRDLHLNLYLNLDLDLDRDLNLNIYLNLNRDLYLDLYLNLNRDLYLNLYLSRDFNRDLNLYLNLYLNRDLYLNLNLSRDFNLYLNRDIYLDLYREIEGGQASNLLLIYFPLIFPLFFYQSLSKIYGEVAQNRKIRQKINLNRQDCEQKSKKFARKRDNIFQLYAYLVLMDQRQKGNMPAWEGIRIVREREEID